jgi:hypothetical protein
VPTTFQIVRTIGLKKLSVLKAVVGNKALLMPDSSDIK